MALALRRDRTLSRDRDRDRDAADDRPGYRARTAGAGAGLLAGIARIVMLVASVLAGIIALAIVFVLLDANTSNTVVSHVHDWARSLVGPFDGMFKIHSAKTAILVNWGIAALVYLVVGSLIAGLLRRVALRTGALA